MLKAACAKHRLARVLRLLLGTDALYHHWFLLTALQFKLEQVTEQTCCGTSWIQACSTFCFSERQVG